MLGSNKFRINVKRTKYSAALASKELLDGLLFVITRIEGS